MEIRYSVLASGSSGNACLVETDQVKILIDVGLTGKGLTEVLGQLDREARDIDGILITHEHLDHVKGLGVMARRYKIPIFTNHVTGQALPTTVGEIQPDLFEYFKTGDIIDFKDLSICTFPISHDAADPVGYSIFQDRTKLVYATDLGYVSGRVRDNLMDADAIIIESNHDVEMLRIGSYPWHLKQRILSDNGHLSNEDAAEVLANVITDNTKHIHLAHLSQENNMPDLAYLTVKGYLDQEQFLTGEKFSLELTYQDRATAMRSIRRR